MFHVSSLCDRYFRNCISGSCSFCGESIRRIQGDQGEDKEIFLRLLWTLSVMNRKSWKIGIYMEQRMDIMQRSCFIVYFDLGCFVLREIHCMLCHKRQRDQAPLCADNADILSSRAVMMELILFLGKTCNFEDFRL